MLVAVGIQPAHFGPIGVAVSLVSSSSHPDWFPGRFPQLSQIALFCPLSVNFCSFCFLPCNFSVLISFAYRRTSQVISHCGMFTVSFLKQFKGEMESLSRWLSDFYLHSRQNPGIFPPHKELKTVFPAHNYWNSQPCGFGSPNSVISSSISSLVVLLCSLSLASSSTEPIPAAPLMQPLWGCTLGSAACAKAPCYCWCSAAGRCSAVWRCAVWLDTDVQGGFQSNHFPSGNSVPLMLGGEMEEQA